jgi:hypothetical protein
MAVIALLSIIVFVAVDEQSIFCLTSFVRRYHSASFLSPSRNHSSIGFHRNVSELKIIMPCLLIACEVVAKGLLVDK